MRIQLHINWNPNFLTPNFWNLTIIKSSLHISLRLIKHCYFATSLSNYLIFKPIFFSFLFSWRFNKYQDYTVVPIIYFVIQLLITIKWSILVQVWLWSNSNRGEKLSHGDFLLQLRKTKKDIDQFKSLISDVVETDRFYTFLETFRKDAEDQTL